MKFYGSLGSIPELSTFSGAEQRRIWRKCLRKAMWTWQFWLIAVIPFLLLIVVYLVAMLFVVRLHSIKVIAFASILTIVISGGLSPIGKHFLIRFMLPFVREELPGYCSSCGYNLTGNTSGICPECGTPVASSAGRMKD